MAYVIWVEWLAEPLRKPKGLESMFITNARRVRFLAAGAVLASAALGVSACGPSAGSTAAAARGTESTSGPVRTPSRPATAPVSPSALPSAIPATAAATQSSPSTPTGGTASSPSTPTEGTAPPQTGTDTFIAEGQDVHGTALYEPACTSGCLLSGDSTAILARMTWTTWSTDAVGTGTYKLDDCVPNCAAGEVFDVATVVTFSRPLLVCLTPTPRWFWSRASFTFPHGLPKALQGDGAPQNPWTFSPVVTEAQATCAD
jgi:hypothetical protein